MNPNRQLDNVQYSESNVSYSFKDNFSLYLFKKIEKLVLAIYLITEHISSEEPIRQAIRDSATELIKDIINSIDNLAEGNQNKIQKSLLEAGSLLDLGASCCLLTKVNVEIVKDEISKVSKEINSHNNAVEGNALVKKSFFNVEIQKDSYIKDIKDIHKRTSEEMSYKKDLKYKDGEVDYISTHSRSDHSNINTNNTNKKVIKKDINFTAKKRATTANNNRTEEILGIVKKKGKVTIKDVSSEITDCSEKTIQRELQKLVSNGVLNKEGERRWSTYSLI